MMGCFGNPLTQGENDMMMCKLCGFKAPQARELRGGKLICPQCGCPYGVPDRDSRTPDLKSIFKLKRRI